ncbi:uncharacterized protein LY89DRAFT_656375 [Mollisia scopiformis]|uniref:BZIP domain-containing protein n=1 Tax=Mollisia scopiformis TaxID=149040 RepID=A0A132BDP4_MOLSC|nr:uncharacterized protein LY89DRAFT_656375 [Mollisia scopiformis]KUJ10542.1 hypothetical protein LY89DRAFT_656375 [Mollisia scopiformis]
MDSGTRCRAAGDKQQSPAKLELSRMVQQVEVRTSEDDWTGIKDAAERRKLQNRLNQRLYRRRRGAKPKVAPQQGKTKIDAAILAITQPEPNLRGDEKESATSGSSNSKSTTLSSGDSDSRNSQVTHPNRYRLRELNRSQIYDLMLQFEASTRQDYLVGSPRTDQLLTLIQFNVFRALLSNTATLGISYEWLGSDEAISPLSSPVPGINPFTPVSLLPTELQRTITHHPWIDVFPFPAMRNNMLLAEDQYDEMALCNDLVEFCTLPNEKTGLIVWKDPWDPSGWEVSETFARRWTWVIKGCRELLESTNYWRHSRGEGPLVWEV